MAYLLREAPTFRDVKMPLHYRKTAENRFATWQPLTASRSRSTPNLQSKLQRIRSEVRFVSRSRPQSQQVETLFYRRDNNRKTFAHSFASTNQRREVDLRASSPPLIHTRQKKPKACKFIAPADNPSVGASRLGRLNGLIDDIKKTEYACELYDWKAELNVSPKSRKTPEVDDNLINRHGATEVWRPDKETNEEVEARQAAQHSRSRATAALAFEPEAMAVVAAMQGKRFAQIDRRHSAVKKITSVLVHAKFPDSQVHHHIPAVTLNIPIIGAGVTKQYRVPASRPKPQLRNEEDTQAWKDSLTVEGRVKLMREFAGNSDVAKADRKAAQRKKKEQRKRALQREREKRLKGADDKMLSQALLRADFKL